MFQWRFKSGSRAFKRSIIGVWERVSNSFQGCFLRKCLGYFKEDWREFLDTFKGASRVCSRCIKFVLGKVTILALVWWPFSGLSLCISMLTTYIALLLGYPRLFCYLEHQIENNQELMTSEWFLLLNSTKCIIQCTKCHVNGSAIFEALTSLYIQRLTFQFVHCWSSESNKELVWPAFFKIHDYRHLSFRSRFSARWRSLQRKMIPSKGPDPQRSLLLYSKPRLF